MPTPGLGTVHAVKGSVLGSGKSLISLIANLAFAKSLFVYSSLCGSLPPRSAWNTAARGGGSGLRVPVLLWASVQCSRSCSVSPQLLTSQAKACFHISEKSEWGRRCWRYRLIWAISPRKRFNFSMHENITKKTRHQIAFFFFFFERQKLFSYALISQFVDAQSPPGRAGLVRQVEKFSAWNSWKKLIFLNDCSEALSLKRAGLWRVSFTHLKGFVVRIKHWVCF